MRKLLYIERLVMAVWLLLLLAVAPAMAQNVVYVGDTTPLTVEQKGLDKYQWHLYSDSTVNFAIAPADDSPPYAEFIGGSNGTEVSVLWKIPGTYFFKVTAVDADDCTMNLKIGRITVMHNPKPVLTAVAIPSICPGGTGEITFTATNVNPGNYTIKCDQDEFANVDIVDSIPFTIKVPTGAYNNLYILADGYSSYDPLNPVNVEVTQPPPIKITASITEINLAANTLGAIELSVQGGNGNYTYLWSTGETTKDRSNLTVGPYIVTVMDENGCEQTDTIKMPPPNTLPQAGDDMYVAGCYVISGNLVINDTDDENDELFIGTKAIVLPRHGELVLSKEGFFEYRADPLFAGKDSFTYELFDKDKYPGVYGTVVLEVFPDADRDGVYDPPLDDLSKGDPDADGDGILNALDGFDDADGDGLPNYLDIDSDGDGIVDNFEAQGSGTAYKAPVIYDANSNGVNDAYDGVQSHYEIQPVDSDKDGIPDYLDLDSDNDSVKDYIEGHDGNRDGRPDHSRLRIDKDNDGLDDGYDSYIMECDPSDNIVRSYAAMQDTDKDGLRDWRDDNDDGDEFPTRFEDLDGDGDYGNDNFDYDAYPEYLDYGRACDLFVPDAFSPNEDGVHDTYMIYCINHFPNAKIYIFDKLGNKLYEKSNYGNEDVWGNDGSAWWDGKPDRGHGKGEKVAPGTYFYVLDLGNGEVKKSFVFVSY